MSIWAELWTRPGDPAFGRVLDDLPFTSFGLHDGVNLLGDGNGTLPDSFEGFDDILFLDHLVPANSVRSLVRLFDDSDPATPFFEWLPSMLRPTEAKASRTVEITGRSIKSVLAEARLEAYDWDGSDDFVPRDPDWQWGGQADNLVDNPGFEQESFPNGGAEDGNADHWTSTEDNSLFNPADSILAVNSAVDARSGGWYILVDPNGAMSGARRSIGNLVVGDTYTIVGYLREGTASGDRYRAGVLGASTATHANAYLADGIWWAELANAPSGTGAADGTYQQFTLTFVAADNQVTLYLVYQDINDFPFQLDDWSITGDAVGIDPWLAFAAGKNAVVNVARVTNTQSYEGSQSLEFQGTDGPYTDPFGNIGYGTIGVTQTLPALEVGRTYTVEARVRHSGAGNQRFRLNLARLTPTGSLQTTLQGTKLPYKVWPALADVLAPPNTWTLVRFSFVPDVAGYNLDLRYVGTDVVNADVGTFVSPTCFFDAVAVYEGLPATTLGDILTQLHDHAIDPNLRIPIVWDNGGTPYLTLDFTALVDSGGQPWWEDALSVKLYMRMRYDQILDQFAGMGYEWRVVPNNVETGTWLLQVYNPGTMKTDHATAGRPAIQGGSSDTRRSIRRALPEGTEFLVEGLGRVTSRDRNLDLSTALGRIETARLDRELPSIEAVVAAAFSDASEAIPAAQSYGYTLAEPADTPLVDYRLGDLLMVHDPPEVSEESRLVDVIGSFTPSAAEYEVELIPATAAGS